MSETDDACICYWVDSKYWFVYFGAVEPGSQMEPNPCCPVHFPDDYRAALIAEAAEYDGPCDFCGDLAPSLAAALVKSERENEEKFIVIETVRSSLAVVLFNGDKKSIRTIVDELEATLGA